MGVEENDCALENYLLLGTDYVHRQISLASTFSHQMEPIAYI